MATKKKVNDTVTQEPEVVNDNTPVKEGPAKEPRVKYQTGTVVKCNRLNVRDKATKSDSKVICIIEAGAKVKIDIANSTDDWYKVRTKTGEEGFCMKSYIAIQ